MNAVLPDRGPEDFGPAHGDRTPGDTPGDRLPGELGHGTPGDADLGHGDLPHGGRRSDTRARIQRVALELFAEQGYERTSLREIAERLGVTKAALYYHFKSKEDIVRSFTEDYFSRLDAIIAWGRNQPPTAHTAHELLDRYITIVLDSGEVFRFLERNQASLHTSEDGKHRFEQFRPRLKGLMEIITGPDASPRSRVRVAAAFFAASTSCMFFTRDASAEADPLPLPDRDELRKIVLELADDLTATPPPPERARPEGAAPHFPDDCAMLDPAAGAKRRAIIRARPLEGELCPKYPFSGIS
jgi:AcrR family transcriptional regulator